LIRNSVDLELKPDRVAEKIKEGKTRRVDPARPGQKLDCDPLTFVFLLKRRHFDFFKKLTRATRSKSGTQALDRAGSKNYAKNSSFMFSSKLHQ
jgi:hypothetical protein